jgi:hypothetical protein
LEHAAQNALRALQKKNGRERRGAVARTKLSLNAKVLPLHLKSHHLIRLAIMAYVQRKISSQTAKILHVCYSIAWNPHKILSPTK